MVVVEYIVSEEEVALWLSNLEELLSLSIDREVSYEENSCDKYSYVPYSVKLAEIIEDQSGVDRCSIIISYVVDIVSIEGIVFKNSKMVGVAEIPISHSGIMNLYDIDFFDILLRGQFPDV